jgi:hypothetical protein
MNSETKELAEEKLCRLFDEQNQITPKISKKQHAVDKIFKPDEKGISIWKTREELEKTPLELTSNGIYIYIYIYIYSRYLL